MRGTKQQGICCFHAITAHGCSDSLVCLNLPRLPQVHHGVVQLLDRLHTFCGTTVNHFLLVLREIIVPPLSFTGSFKSAIP